jgi:hypothetical protein
MLKEYQKGKLSQGLMSAHRRPGLVITLLFLSLLMTDCRQPQALPDTGEGDPGLSATPLPDYWMVTDPTTVELASGTTTFVWFFAPY